MPVNSKDKLILIKGEDKTSSVFSWKYDTYKPVVFITYDSGGSYPYKISDVKILSKQKSLQVKDKIVTYNNCPKLYAESVQVFGQYSRIIYRNGCSEICLTKDIKIISSALDNKKSRNCFDYLRNVAKVVGLSVNGHNILFSHYEKIDFVRNDSVLAMFLSGEYKQSNIAASGTNIYPFGFNISQREAIDNALKSNISIIEGPPGTGKTQTILNIIANAVMRGESVAVVSSNNSATDNVYEKLAKYGVDFIAAPLGSSDNKKEFIVGQSSFIPDLSKWNKSPKVASMSNLINEFDIKLRLKNDLSAVLSEEDLLKKEKKHFDDYYKSLNFNSPMPKFSKRTTAKQVLMFANEYEYLISAKKKMGFFKKIAMRLAYGIKKFDFLASDCGLVLDYCQNLFYEKRLNEINSRRKAIETELKSFNFDMKMREYTELSMCVFKNVLWKKYNGRKRRIYSQEDLRQNANDFISDYPVVLSTTYSLRSSLSRSTCYDYVIVDEASQVDLATGALALSCAKKAVIVGDLKQLPNVVNREQKAISDAVFSKYNLPEYYSYSDHSLLSSIIMLFPDAPRVLLKEHYRCHPEIIGFCNRQFYNNELTILTESKPESKAMMIYRTAAGNMARGHINERQIDVIKNEVIVEQNLNVSDGSVGIVTPYRAQANRLQEEFKGTGVKADTADKFQGQERSVIILSTVDNQIGEFVSNPNRLNVAISRAIDRFILVTDGNDNDKTSPIHELIGYIEYNNHEVVNSKINSVFDYLYRVNSEARKTILQKYGKVSEFDSENLMYMLLREILKKDSFSHLNVVMHTPLRKLLRDLSGLNERETTFASNHLTHVDFLIYSKVSHNPVLVIEVDGFAYHNNEKQKERDLLKDTILAKYDIPILRLSTTGSDEKNKIETKLVQLVGSF